MLEEKLKEYNDLKKQLSSFTDSVKNELIEGIKKITLEIMEKQPSVCEIIICGYTPSFNDGDPCEYTYYCDLEYRKGERSDSDEKRKSIESIDKYQDILEDCLGSNWKISCFRKDSEITFCLDENYDCGY